jgi:hypothetical protein
VSARTTEHAAAVYRAALAWQQASTALYIRYERASADYRAELDAVVRDRHMAFMDLLTKPLTGGEPIRFYDLIRDDPPDGGL